MTERGVHDAQRRPCRDRRPLAISSLPCQSVAACYYVRNAATLRGLALNWLVSEMFKSGPLDSPYWAVSLGFTLAHLGNNLQAGFSASPADWVG